MTQDPDGTAKAADHTHEQTGGATGAYVHAHDGADAHGGAHSGMGFDHKSL